MGFELFVDRFRKGVAAPYPRKIAEDIFDRDALRPSGLQYVEYSDGRGEIYCGDRDEGFCGFMLAHFGGRTICERALEIAAVTESLIFWPSPNIKMGVTDLAFVEHLPDEVREKESVALVRSVDELWAAIEA